MGYRTYIASIPKREYNKIKSMTKNELIDYKKINKNDVEENYIGIGVYDFGEELYEFGKYTDFEPPRKSTSTFFKKKELNEYFTEEHDFYVVTKEFLAYIIEYYSQKIRKYYSEMLMPFHKSIDEYGRVENSVFLKSIKTEYNYPNNKHTFDFSKISDEEQTAIYIMYEHVKLMAQEWGVYTHSDKIRPYSLESTNIVSSWKYEYSVFELIHIYNTFDWKKNVMFYYGY